MNSPESEKSVSENVVFATPTLPNTGNKATGKNDIMIPFTNDPTIAPLLPPVELPNTAEVAPKKKCGTTPGIIITSPIAPSANIEINPPMKELINPINTAFGAYANTIGQSNAGLEFGTNLSEIPLNAGTISARTNLTPFCININPAEKVNACIKE